MAARPPGGLVELAPAGDIDGVPRALRVLEGSPPGTARMHLSGHLELAGLRFGRLSALGRFWPKDNVRELVQRWQETLGGLHALGQGLVFCVFNREGRDLEYLMAYIDRDADAATLLDSVRARLPGSTVEMVSDARARATPANAVHDAACWTALRGVPDMRPVARGADSGALAALSRALGTRPWGLLVFAEPCDERDVEPFLEAISDEVRTVSPWTERSVTGVLGMTGHEQHPLVTRYVELLNAEFKRLAEGRRAGLWATRSYFFGADEASTAVFRATMLGAAAGAKVARPLRVSRCGSPGEQGEDPVTVLTSAELGVLTRPSAEEAPGFPVRDHAVFDTHPEPVRAGAEGGDTATSVTLGEVVGRAGVTVGIETADLCRHALVVGITGSGKTTAVWGLLDSLARLETPVPFLVIEPAKREYRSLPLPEPLRVYTVGDERIAPLRLNPFEVPDGILVQTHIDYLNVLFRASFALYPPMPYVLERCLYEVYTDKGWDLASNLNTLPEDARGASPFPTLRDLGRKVEEVSGRLGYGTEVTMNVRAALLTRIDTLRIGAKGMMLDTDHAFDIEGFLSRPTVVELERVGSDEEKAFLMGLLLTRVFEHRQAQGGDGGHEQLKHVTVVEEAHRLLRNRVASADPESADPAAHAVEQFANMLAEVRSLGEGIVVAEQIPAKLAPDVMKNTSLKVVFRLVAEDDKRSVGSTINLEEDQARVLTSLPRGEALVFREGMDRPIRVHAGGLDVRERAMPLDDDDVKLRMRELSRRDGSGTAHEAVGRDGRAALPASLVAAADSLVGSAGFARVFLHWALACARRPSVIEEEARLRDRVREIALAEIRPGFDAAQWLNAVVVRGAEELPAQLALAGSRAFRAEGVGALDQALRASAAVSEQRMAAAAQALGVAIRDSQGGIPRPYPGCAPVCPEAGCLFKHIARPLLDDDAVLRSVRRSVFAERAQTAPTTLLGTARAAGSSVLTELAPGIPTLIGCCAAVQALSRVADDAVVIDAAEETLGLARQRGYL